MSYSEAPMSLAELLDQDRVWYARNGRTLICHKLDEMEIDHIKSLRAWLLRNAESIHYGILNDLERAGCAYASEQAQLDIDREIDRMGGDPERWIRETMLFEALTERLETVAIGSLTKTNIATIMRLVRLALSSPPGTHTETQLKAIEAVRRKLEGTGREVGSRDPQRV